MRVVPGTFYSGQSARVPGPRHAFWRFLLAALGLVLSSTAGHAQPILSDEFPVSTPVVIQNGKFPRASAVASNGSGFLVAWWEEETYLIKATRVTAEGEVVDVGGLRIGSSEHGNIEIAWDGTNYVVAWSTFSSVLAKRVSPDGVVLDERPIAIDGHFRGIGGWDVVGNGTGSLFVVGYKGNVYATRMDASGTIIDASPIVVSDASGYQGAPSVAWNGNDYLVVWTDDRSDDPADLFGSRIDSGGQILDPTGVEVFTGPGRQDRADIAWTGATYMVTWQHQPSGNSSVRAARLDADGLILDPEIAVGDGDDQSAPKVSSNGISTVIVWGASSQIRAMALDESGVPSLPEPMTLSPETFESHGHAVASIEGGGHLATFADTTDNSQGIRSLRLDETGTTLVDPEPTDVSVAIDDQFDPTIVWNGSGYLAAWGNQGLWTSRLAADGTMLDERPTRVVSLPSYLFDVVWVGDHYLLVWFDYSNYRWKILAQRLDENGLPLDQEPTRIARAGYPEGIDVGTSGNESLIVSTHGGQDVVGYLVGGDGGPLSDEPIQITAARDYQSDPAIAWNGSHFLVTWEDYRNRRVGRRSDLYGARVAPRGRVLDPDGIAISKALGWQQMPAVASNGESWLVSWFNETRENCTISLAIVSANGRVTARDVPVSTRRKCETSPSVTATTRGYVVAWTKLVPYSSIASKVYATEVRPKGRVETPGGIEIASNPDGIWRTASLASSGDETVVAYSKYQVGNEYKGALRAFIRFMVPNG